ncbi:MAG: DUF3150 domain-containing protein [Mailhella sp.]|nr:DUF3150 domain-containing protein [Mailhella sp.]
MITDIKIAAKTLVIAPDIRIWSARKKMQAEDYGADKDSLPPDDIATLGVKKLCPPDKLRVFGMLKSRATTLLARHGVPFLPGSWLVPADKAAEINDALGQIKADFDKEKESFLSDYDHTCADWISQHPEYAEMLQNSMASPDYVRSRLSFGWRAFALRMTKHTNLKDELQHLGDSVFADIAKEAAVVRREVFSDRDVVTQKALNPIRALGEKLRGLSFVHPLVASAASLVSSCLESMPPKGNIEGAHLGMVMALLTLLSDPVALEECTLRMGTQGTDPLSLLMPAPKKHEPRIPATPVPPSPLVQNVGLW